MIPIWLAAPFAWFFVALHVFDGNFSAALWAFSCACMIHEQNRMKKIYQKVVQDGDAYHEAVEAAMYESVTFREAMQGVCQSVQNVKKPRKRKTRNHLHLVSSKNPVNGCNQ